MSIVEFPANLVRIVVDRMNRQRALSRPLTERQRLLLEIADKIDMKAREYDASEDFPAGVKRGYRLAANMVRREASI